MSMPSRIKKPCKIFSSIMIVICIIALLPVLSLAFTGGRGTHLSRFRPSHHKRDKRNNFLHHHHVHPSTCTIRPILAPGCLNLSFDNNSGGSDRNKKVSKSSISCEFELQELRAQTASMIQQKVPSRALTKEKQAEITSYIKKVVNNSVSPVPLKDIGASEGLRLMGSWQLAFSTEAATMGDLPLEASVVLKFLPYLKMEYTLGFSKKVWGLSRLTAKSTYTIDSTPLNPGLVTFVYDDIVTDVLGFENLPVGFFGLLKGRSNFIESIWFDGDIWIDRGFNPQGVEYFNCYRKENN